MFIIHIFRAIQKSGKRDPSIDPEQNLKRIVILMQNEIQHVIINLIQYTSSFTRVAISMSNPNQ
jgi:hypothetical protein